MRKECLLHRVDEVKIDPIRVLHALCVMAHLPVRGLQAQAGARHEVDAQL